MAHLILGLEFLTGRCAAMSATDREAAEWPPHPGRIFMALAAACFEMGEDAAEVAALEWLEQLPPPVVEASDHSERTLVKFFVPVNDRLTPNKSILQTTPGMTRSKQERTFPTAIPHDPVVRLIWEDIDVSEAHLEALDRVCANTIRVGHSSSLVRAWIEKAAPLPLATPEGRRAWTPSNTAAQWHARVTDAGTLDRLRSACNMDRIERFAALKLEIDSAKGKAQKETKQVFESVFGQPYKSSFAPPEPKFPQLGLWQGYASHEEISAPVAEGEHFEQDLLVLAKCSHTDEDERNFGIEDTVTLTARLREAVMSLVNQTGQSIPQWLSGHEADGVPSQSPHVAFLALPFVGARHADGHLMGLAIALPKPVPPQERGRVLGPLLYDDQGEPQRLTLKLGHLGTWTVQVEERTDPPKTLHSRTWTSPSRTWASVTPVVLDRFPKASRGKDRARWEEEVRQTVANACTQSGLPRPVEIDLDTTSWHAGSARATTKTRKSRDRGGESRETPLGGGFPSLPSRAGKPVRPQIHVHLCFAERVAGPVLLGAGRFLGYGLCRPISPTRNRA